MKKYTLHVLYVSLFAIFIFGYTYLPLQDYPVLTYQGFVFNEFVFHANTFGGFFHLQPYLPPNAVSTVVIGIIDIFADPFLAGKIYLFALVLALYTGIIRYLRFHLNADKMAFASIAFYLTINIHLLMCYMNFLSGLALVFHAIVFIRRRKYESNIPALSIVIFLIYLCHFAPLAIFALYFFYYYLTKKDYSGLLRCGISAIPALIIFLQYLLSRTIPILPTSNELSSFIDLIHWKFLIFFQPLIPFNVFKWVNEIPLPLRMIDYTYSVIVLILICYIHGKNIIRHNLSLEMWLAVSTFIVAIILPFYFGGVYPAGERVVAFCVVNLCIVGYRMGLSSTLRRISFALLFLLGIGAYSYDLWNTAKFNSMAARNEIPPDAIIHPNIKLEGTNPFMHLDIYDGIRQKKAIPCFNVGLFAYPGSDKE